MASEEKYREIIIKALTDPNFRQKLKDSPASIFGVKELSSRSLEEINSILDLVSNLDSQISKITKGLVELPPCKL
ncbi:MAG: hypothetical protein ACTSRP_15565 [Candidatus Helarchaeota archaeon]